MANVKFPPVFTHTFGQVTEITVPCDVYGDESGLRYWIYAADSVARKKGDLMKIEYGPSRRMEREIEYPSGENKPQ